MTDVKMWAAAAKLQSEYGQTAGMAHASALAAAYRAKGDHGSYACWLIVMSRIPLLSPAENETLH